MAKSDWGRAYPKPTRLLGRLARVTEVIFEGPPSHDSEGSYMGPLPKTGVQAMVVGKDSLGDFRTGSTAAWPPMLCEALAERIVEHHLLNQGKAQENGGDSKDGD